MDSRQIVSTLATNHALKDLKIFLKSLMLWPNLPTVYLYADKQIVEALPSIGYKGELFVKEALNNYSGKTRQEMERVPGAIFGKSLWFEFQMEKLSLLEWAFASVPEATKTGVFYLDSDICFFKSVPAVSPSYDVALSPHRIRTRDEALYGKYNAGYLWVRTPEAVAAWRAACATSRFFEQAALEIFDSEEWVSRTHLLPTEMNYGWWRMFQGEIAPADLQREWTLFRNQEHSGILVGGAPLASVHTHWTTGDPMTQRFNTFIMTMLAKLAPSHPSARKMLAIVSAK